MDAILQGLSGIFEVAVIAGLGFFLSRMGFFWESAGKDLTKFTMSVALPPLMIYSLYSNFTHDQLIETAPDMLLPFASIFVAYLAGRVLAKVLNITKGRRGVFTCECHFHRPSGQYGALRRSECAFLHAVLYRKYRDVLVPWRLPHRQGCRR